LLNRSTVHASLLP
jgi:hypothetical protein